MVDPHKVLDAAIQLVAHATEWAAAGQDVLDVAASALEALHERLFPEQLATGPEGAASSAFASHTVDQQTAIDDLAESCRGEDS